MAAAEPGYESDEQREDSLAAQAMRRQAVLSGRRLNVVLGEGALYQAVGGPEVMAGQLAYLARLAREACPLSAYLIPPWMIPWLATVCPAPSASFSTSTHE